MDASIIIITKNQKAFLEKTLPMLAKQKFNGKFEVIVVDSGSTDGAQKYSRSLNAKVISINPNTFNYANAFNTGASAASGKYLVRLSGDCIPTSADWLTNMTAPYNNLKIGGTFGKYIISGKEGFTYPIYWDKKRFPNKNTVYHCNQTFLLGISLSYFTIGNKVFDFAGGCCSIRRSIWIKRPFNETLTNSEDAEYSWFLHTTGHDIAFCNKATVLHEHLLSPEKYEFHFLGISRTQIMVQKHIWKYWLLRIVGKDPFEKYKI